MPFNEDDQSGAKKYLLNLLFGGNEMQESSARAVMSESAENNCLKKCTIVKREVLIQRHYLILTQMMTILYK